MSETVSPFDGSDVPDPKNMGEAACKVIDHLVDALAYHSSCRIRRAIVVIDIYAHGETTQKELMERLKIDKSTMTRDIAWLYDYGVILKTKAKHDARAQVLSVTEYSAEHLERALSLVHGSIENLILLLKGFIRLLKDETASLRDAKIIAFLYNRENVSRADIIKELYEGSPATEGRAIQNLIDEGLIDDAIG